MGASTEEKSKTVQASATLEQSLVSSVAPCLPVRCLNETRPGSPRLRVLLVHALFAFLEQTDGLLRLLRQVLHEDAEVLVVTQSLHLALVTGQDGAKMLVGVGQQVQDVRRTVLEGELRVLA